MKERYFPQGIATQHTFCNRTEERMLLKESILAHEHLVLVAPRRYGKTSLITQVLKENKFPSVNIDFFFVLNQGEVIKHITEGVSQVISKLLPKTRLAGEKLVSKVKAMNPKLTFNLMGQTLEISTRHTTGKSISELLLALDHFAEKTNTSSVMVFDEFQQIGELKENHAIEAEIRHAVERSQHITYIFCGSKHHLLNKMFTDKSRPLYHLCDLMTIERMSTESYRLFLNEMAKKRWGKFLAEDTILEIINLTENHPYYINALCRRLWRMDTVPHLAKVRNIWDDYVMQQAPWIITDIDGLTLNRRKILSALAQQPVKEAQGQKFSQRAGLAPSAIKIAIQDLQKLDIIFQDKEGFFRVLDPTITYFLQHKSF